MFFYIGKSFIYCRNRNPTSRNDQLGFDFRCRTKAMYKNWIFSLFVISGSPLCNIG